MPMGIHFEGSVSGPAQSRTVRLAPTGAGPNPWFPSRSVQPRAQPRDWPALPLLHTDAFKEVRKRGKMLKKLTEIF